MSEVKPIAWTTKDWLNDLSRTGEGTMCNLSLIGDGIPLYDQSAIDRLTAERDDALAAVDANWVSHQRVVKAESERDAAVADAEGYRKIRKLTPCRFKKIQDEAIIDAVDVKYFHSDIFDAALDAVIEEQEQGK